ncbi:MAG TPA: hypothetical protein VIL48_10095 [Acidimicrobiales bacterium]
MSTTDARPTLAKADFDGIYDQPDPRPYFHGLGAHDYSVPHYGQHVFRRVLNALDVDSPTVLDVCCSYGVNAALLKHDIGLADLYDHYRSDEVADLTSEELAAVDRERFAACREGAPTVIGLDAASNAIAYGVEVGLLDQGVVENLEENPPSPELATAVGSVDLVTVTGGIGYVTERTFDRLFECTDPERRPWLAALCLRTVPFEPIADRLATHGLVTEQLDGVTYPQRRFASEDERAYALGELDALGIDPTGRESEGSYHVNVFLARPVDEAAERPIEDILGDLPEEPDHIPSA